MTEAERAWVKWYADEASFKEKQSAEAVFMAGWNAAIEAAEEKVEDWLPPIPLSGQEIDQIMNRNRLIAEAIRELRSEGSAEHNKEQR